MVRWSQHWTVCVRLLIAAAFGCVLSTQAEAQSSSGGQCCPSYTDPGNMYRPSDPQQMFGGGMSGQAPAAPAPMTSSSQFTAASSPQSIAPNMVGDFFGTAGSSRVQSRSGLFFTDTPNNSVQTPSTGSGGAAAVTGRIKIAENTSPIPRDRVFINYSLFEDVPLRAQGAQVHRFSPGIEKTFLDGMMSLEVRVPFASTLDPNFVGNGPSPSGDDSVELGNVQLAGKIKLYETDDLVFAGGLVLTIPTANDLTVSDGSLFGAPTVVAIDNDSFHLMPLVGVLYTPTDRWFMQAYAQLDFDLNGNSVQADRDGAGTLESVGTISDVTFLYLSGAVGYWIYRDYHANWITGISPVAEMHWNKGLTDADVLTPGGATDLVIGSTASNFSNLNILLAMNFQIHNNAMLTVGYGLPLGGGSDEQFDGELRVLFNWFFGGRPYRGGVPY